MLERSRNLVEGFKSMLIFLLALSTLYLSGKAFMPYGDRGEEGMLDILPLSTEEPLSSVGVSRPLRMAVLNEGGRYGVQYDSTAVDLLFDDLGDLLGEGLGSAGTAAAVDRTAWEIALQTKGVYYDFPGMVSLPLLSAWLGEGESGQTAYVTAIILSVEEGTDSVRLYYEEAETGAYYACDTLVQFRQRLDGYTSNEAFFAFQQPERFGALHPDTLILSQVPEPPVYKVAAGINVQNEEGLENLLHLLSFSPQPNAIYPSAGGWNVREAEDNLRLTRTGNIYYHGAGDSDRYFFSHETRLEDWVTFTGELVSKLMTSNSGAGRIYLDEVAAKENGWILTYRYCLSGADVQLGQDGWCAQFTVKNDRLTEYVMKVRRYEATVEDGVLLPEYQAMHAMIALDADGRRLLVRYYDGGTGTTVPDWIAR